MTHPYRREKLASIIKDVVGETLAFHMHDPRIPPMTSVTRVEMTGDLLIAKVFVSVPGGMAVEQLALSALRHAAGYLQRIVAGELSIRHCPHLRFEIDEALKHTKRILDLMEQNRKARLAKTGQEVDFENEESWGVESANVENDLEKGKGDDDDDEGS